MCASTLFNPYRRHILISRIRVPLITLALALSAWIAYINKGSVTDATGTTNQKWLESAFLEKQAGVCKIVFMHSTRTP